jgi:hypothetical protein
MGLNPGLINQAFQEDFGVTKYDNQVLTYDAFEKITQIDFYLQSSLIATLVLTYSTGSLGNQVLTSITRTL